jgi:peptidoglycan/xylan/chitin deacetylase (PgdA/CDA1 family)
MSRKAARHHRSKPFVMRNSAPLVTFTFDDVPDSAFTNDTAVLEDRGVHGTFYIASGICGTADTHWRLINDDQVRALHSRNSTIGL